MNDQKTVLGTITLSALKAIDRATGCASTDATRWALNAVRLTLPSASANAIDIASSDGHKAIFKTIVNGLEWQAPADQFNPRGYIIAREYFENLSAILKRAKKDKWKPSASVELLAGKIGEMRIQVFGMEIVFASGESYPNIDQVWASAKSGSVACRVMLNPEYLKDIFDAIADRKIDGAEFPDTGVILEIPDSDGLSALKPIRIRFHDSGTEAILAPMKIGAGKQAKTERASA